MPNRYPLLVPLSARSLTWLGICVVFTFSFLTLVGWLLNIALLKSIGFQWIPMKMTTAICFALLAFELVILQKKFPGSHTHPLPLKLPGIVVSLVGFLTIVFYSGAIITEKEIYLGGAFFHALLWATATRMSLLTAVLFLVNGIVLTLLVSGSRRAAAIAHAVMVPAIIAGYLVPVSYLLGVQGLHESLKVPVALNTGICFCALGVAVFCVRPDTWLMKVFTGDHAGGLMARRLLPGLVMIPLVIGWLRLYGERSGAFGSEVGVVLVALAYTFCLLGLVWITARSVNKTDEKRRQAEEALHEEHDFVSAVLDTAGAIVVVLDRQGRITRFNRACELITGYTATEVLGRIFWEFLVPPEDLPGVRETWEALNAGQFPNQHENYWQAKDGARRLIAWSNTVMTDPEGELQHIIGTGIDVTEQRQAEAALRASEERFKAIASNTPDHILVQDHELRYTAVINPQLGLTEQDMIGKNDHDFLSLEDADKITRIKKQVLETGLPVYVETSLISQKGEEEFFDGSYVPKRTADGEIDGLIGYFRNITERKRMEEELRRSEQRWATTLASIGDAVISTDTEGHITFMNAVAEELTGWTLSEASLMPIAEVFKIINEQTRREVDCPVARVLREGMIIGLANHTILVRKDGTEVPIDDSGAPIRDAEGKTVGVVLVFRDITERKRLEEDLNKRQIELQSLFNHSNAGLVLFDGKPPYTVLAHNKFYQELFAEPFRTQGMVGKNVYEYTPEVEAKGVVAVFDEVLRTKQAVNLLDFPYDSNPPEKSWFNWHLSPVIHDGEVVALASMSINVTNQHVVEQALRESEEHFRALAENIPDMIMRFDRDLRVIYANPAALKRVGLPEEKLIGRKAGEYGASPAAASIWEKAAREAIDSGQPQRIENTNHWQGEARVFDVQIIPEREADGALKAVVAIARDITKRKRAEEALRESEERYRNLFNTMDEGFCIIEMIFDAEGRPADYRFLEVNAAFEKQTGLHDAEGKLMRDLAPDHETHWFEIYGKIALTGEPLHFENEARALNHWYDVYAYRVGKPEDRQVAIVFNDISVRRKAEEALRKAHDSLELRVHERTAELDQAYEALQAETTEREQTQEQLRQSQKMEALGVLTGGIAHDFNNILSAVIGFAEMAADDVPTESQTAHSLRRVLQASSRGRDLIKQMLTFSRRTKAEKKPLRLSSLINETMKLIRASIPTTISIRVNLKNESALISADPTQIQQVLMNLCTNAAYAMGERGGVLDVELGEFILSDEMHDQLKPGAYMKLVVRDSGVGIPPEHMDKIFDPFFTTKQLGEGTGLGLSVVHGIVHQHEGHITVESEPGHGAVFSLYFPKIIEEASRDALTDETVLGGHERILFIDDEELIMEMGQMVLERLGYEVVSVININEALSLFKVDPARFDLVITDQTMPEMTGVELAKAILAIRPDMPVILCTGFSHLVDADAAKEAGIKAFAMKPMTKSEIAKTIRKVLDK